MRPDLDSYAHVASGKVRDIYRIDDQTLLMVTSDRISAYDFVLDTPIPDKGRVLTATSFFWFEHLAVPNHLAGGPTDERIPSSVLGRSMVVHDLPMVAVECVARGYLTGSGLLDYNATGAVCGIALPAGLGEASKLPEPIFTPATKAEVGDHDENISYDKMAEIIGGEMAAKVRELAVALYKKAADFALTKGIIIADTKFEFGHVVDANGNVDTKGDPILIDEALTPDSSRFWPKATYSPGKAQLSYDKQFLREYLESLVAKNAWNKQAPGPALPAEIASKTLAKYQEARDALIA